MPDVLCLGIFVADVIARPVDSYPQRGQLILVERMETHIGGCAANTAIDLAKLGFNVGAMGKVGCDGFGDFVLNTLQRHGVDTRGVVRDPEHATSGTMVLVHSDGERSFLHYLGANAALTDADVDFNLVQQAKLLHIAGHFLMPKFDGKPAARVLQRAQAMGVTTTLDTAWDSRGNWMRLLRHCLPYIEYFVPSYEEAKMCAGRDNPRDVAQVFLDAGVKVVALKMGEQGCYLRTHDTEIRLPAYKVNTIDATGAGDAFAAGFLAGVLKGWDLELIGKFANAVGALCTTAIGTTTGVRGLEETMALVEKGMVNG
ncbi:MAG: sugar kinase [Abditibacteriales bacterium]|nr:sugar kinase [Abditibacteriales bacterium]MDW8368205.1 sugar kinase [Abditibacteriales bacterium]